jgi:type II secretory pathway predicted ATPase ExeA
MLLRHFNLNEQPFGVTPNPRYLYSSATHREALAALVYGLESGLGFVTLTANPGMGKTTLLFEVLRKLSEKAKTVFLFQTISTPADLFRALLIDLGVENPQGTLVDHQTQLNQMLVQQSASGRRLIIVIDEAQNLDDTVLEAVRMLSNFETGHSKLMHILLSGQLQLAERLAGPQLLQLRQRISIFAHLRPLGAVDTAGYIRHRLKTAGWKEDEDLFTPAAVTLIAEASRGIPRNINNLCFNAMTIACAMQKNTIDVDTVSEVVADLDIGAILAAAQVQPAIMNAQEKTQSDQLANGVSQWMPASSAVHAHTGHASGIAAELKPRKGTIRRPRLKVGKERVTVVEAIPHPAAGMDPVAAPGPAPAVESAQSIRQPRGLSYALSSSSEDLAEGLGVSQSGSDDSAAGEEALFATSDWVFDMRGKGFSRSKDDDGSKDEATVAANLPLDEAAKQTATEFNRSVRSERSEVFHEQAL